MPDRTGSTCPACAGTRLDYHAPTGSLRCADCGSTQVITIASLQDVQRLLACQPDYLKTWAAERYRVAAAEAWERLELRLSDFERARQGRLRQLTDARDQLDQRLRHSHVAVQSALMPAFITYYDYASRHFHPKSPERTYQPPVDWLSMALAAAIGSMVITALVLFVMNQGARPAGRATLRAARRRRSSPPAVSPAAPSSIFLPISLPLRC